MACPLLMWAVRPGMRPATVSVRRKLIVCAATLAFTATGPIAAAATHHAHHARSASDTGRPLGGPNFTGIFLSTWGTSHVTFSKAVRSWLARSGATVTARPPMTLDADRGGFTMPASRTSGDRLDVRGRMDYPGALVISLPAQAKTSGHATRRLVCFGPLYIRVMPTVSWSAALSVNGVPAAGDVVLATADYSEVLAAGGTPSPSGFRVDSVPFHLSQDAVDLLERASGRTAPDAGTLLGTLTPRFDHVPTQG